MENSNKNTVRENILKHRNACGWTQADLAERIGMKTSTYATKEAKGNFKTSELLIIADAFKTDVKEFFLYESQNETSSIPQRRVSEPSLELEQEPDLLLSSKERAMIHMMRASKQNKNILLSVMGSLRQKNISEEKLNQILKLLND